jgi:hypothetical protein
LLIEMIWRRNANSFVVVWTPDDGQSLGPKEVSLQFEQRDPRLL